MASDVQYNVSFYNYKFDLYEDDGDSVLGSIFPNVQISRVILETGGQDGGNLLIDREPHIVGNQSVNPQSFSVAVSGGDETQPMQVTLELMIKEKIEKDDTALFTIDQIVNSLKVAVYLSVDKGATTNIISTDNNDSTVTTTAGVAQVADSNTYVPHEVGRYLAGDFNDLSSSLKAFINDFGLLFRKEISLKEIGLFNNLVDFVSGKKSYAANLDSEILSDGTVVYKIPFTTTFSIPKQLGGVDVKHLTAFTTSYISLEALFDGKTEQGSWSGYQKQQIAELGYTNPSGSPIAEMARTQIFQYFNNFAPYIAYKNEIIIDGKVNNKNKKLIYQGTHPSFESRKNKVYYGAAHYHSSNDPGPNGYIGWMGGTKEHMKEVPPPLLPKLKQVSIDAPGEIIDHRTKAFMDQLFFNYSDFGTNLTYKELASPVPMSLATTGVEAQYEKQTKSNDWLKAKEQSIFSDPFYSVDEEGGARFLFSIDIEKAILYNTAYPGYLATAAGISENTYKSLISKARINKLSVSRIEVSKEKDNGGKNYVDEKNNTPVFLISSADGPTSGKLTKATNTNENEVFTLQNVDDVAHIGEANLAFAPLFVRNFSVLDNTVREEKSEAKVFQYIIDLEISDPVFDELSSKLSGTKKLSIALQNYLRLSQEKHSYTNNYTNTFTKEFIERFKLTTNGVLVQGQNKNLPTIQHFEESVIWSNVTFFLDNVLFRLKSFSQDKKAQISNYMRCLLSTYSGSPSGIDAVLGFVLNVERNLGQLLDSVASTKSKKSILATDGDDVAGKISSSSTEAKNVIRIEKRLEGSFDTNFDGDKGYQYLFTAPQGTISTFPAKIYPKMDTDQPYVAGGLHEISLANLEKVFKRNEFFYQIPDNFTSIGADPPLNARTSYLGPRKIKTYKGDKILNQSDLMLNHMIDILESNAENTTSVWASGETDSNVYPAPVEYTALDGTKFITYRTEMPNMMNLLSSEGVSFDAYRQYDKKVAKEFAANSPSETGISKDLDQNYMDTLKSLFGPDNTQYGEASSDSSFVAIYLILSIFSNYLPDFKLEKYINLMVDSVNDETSSYNYKNFKELPNQLLALFNKISIEALGNTNNNLPGDSGYESYRAQFETFLNTAKLALTLNTMVRLEYFDGYENGDFKKPIFKLLKNNQFSDIVTYGGIGEGNVILMRVVPHGLSGFELPEHLKMPIFDQYFLLGA